MEAEQQEAMNYDNPSNRHAGSIVFMTNPEPIIKEMEARLRGQRINEETNKAEDVGDALLNEKGINTVSTYVRSLLNRVIIMGNLNKETRQKLMTSMIDILCKDLMMGRIKYDILEPASTTRSTIVEVAGNHALSGLLRAESEGDRRFWKGSQQEITYRTDQQGKQKSAWEAMGSWGG